MAEASARWPVNPRSAKPTIRTPSGTHCSRLRTWLESDLRVVREEVAPQEPVVLPRNLAVRRVEAVPLHQLRQGHGSIARLVRRARAQPVELDAPGLHGFELRLERLVDRRRPRTEDADVRRMCPDCCSSRPVCARR